MKRLISALFLMAAVGVAGAAEQAPQLSPEALDKIKAHLLDLHAARIKVLTEGEACVKVAKSADALQACIEQERNAIAPGNTTTTKGKGK